MNKFIEPAADSAVAVADPPGDGEADMGTETPNPQPADDDPTSPANLARWDAETARIVSEEEEDVARLEAEFDDAHAVAAARKKRFEAAVQDLRDLIRDRRQKRGQKPDKPAPTLVDNLPWRELPLADLDLPEELETPVWEECETVGEVADALAAGTTFDLSPEDLDKVREAVGVFRAKHEAKAEADPLAELWREFPVAGWTEYGLTTGDVEKLREGEVKRTGERFPVVTVGDLNRFVTPNPANPDFTRTYADLKGFGEAAATRLSDAEEKFWKAWKEGGLREKFAGELGRLPAGETGATATIELPAEPSANGDHKPKKGGKK